MRIALDAMGGDHAPGPIVAGALEAVCDQPELIVVLVGDQAQVEAELAKAPGASRDRLPIVHASQVVGMDEKPIEALRKKRDSSISKCWGLMAGGDVKAVVSAGNTGAMVASALFNAKMFLPGVRRPGIAAIFPSHRGPIVIIDVGANMNPKAEDLYQYGVMGAIYAETILGVAEPRIGLMNVGSEDDKGTDLTRATRALYQSGPLADRFVGNVEGRDIYEGHARVVVCEGFVGNVLLKFYESMSGFMSGFLRSAIQEQGVQLDLELLFRTLDYTQWGGAPLLGVNGVTIICHGGSPPIAIRNALRAAASCVESGMVEHIAGRLNRLAEATPAQ
jgi:glycerol-3-phosphate acyltransferase PlsX